MKRVLLSIGFIYLGLLLGCGGGASNNGNGGNAQPPVLQSIQVSPAGPSITLTVNASNRQQFTATGQYSDGSSKDLTSSVTWSSSDTNVATIASSGLATGKAVGSTTITATSGSVSNKATLIVTISLVSIAVTPATVSIAPATNQQFTATGTFTDGSIQNLTSQVTWNSSGAAVGSISNTEPTNGLVQALTPGTSTITATSGSIISAPAMLTVTNATVASIAVIPATSTIGWGSQQQFTSKGTFSDGTQQDITNVSTWASSAPSIAFVTTNSGLAIGKALGTATITATFPPTGPSVSGNALLTVNLSNLTSISVRPATPSIANGTSLQFTAIGTFGDGSTRNLVTLATWTSSMTNIATIGSNSGLATTQNAGVTTITASAGSQTGSTGLTVSAAILKSISVAPAGATIAAGTNRNFTASGTFSDGTTQDLTTQVIWASSDTSVATVGPRGLVAGKSTGTTTITATSSAFLGSIMGSAPVTVSSAALVSIAVKPGNSFIPPGATIQYSANGSYNDGSTQDISQSVLWTSSAPSVASITSFGLATAQGQGKTTISAQLSGVTGSTSLLVTSSSLVSIAITPSNSHLAFDTSAQLTATGTFGDGSAQNLTTSVSWTSSSSSVATIGAQTGIIMAGANQGQTGVTAVFGNIVGMTTVTVTNATLTSITVSPGSASIALGSSQTFTASGKFSDNSTQDLTLFADWTSSSQNVAVVNSFGLATTSGQGTTNITAPFTQNGVTVPSNAAILTVHP